MIRRAALAACASLALASMSLDAPIVASAAEPSAATSEKPDLVLTGVVTGADHQTYRDVPFAVPPGVDRVTVSFAYTGRDQHTAIDLGLFDADSFRGWSGGNKSSFTVSDTDATPSYLPGAIHAGRWRLVLGVPNARPAVHASFEARIYFHRAGDPLPRSAFAPGALAQGARWYRGDLHMHTAHSDGVCASQSGASVPCPLFRTAEVAAADGLDFIAITDHNTVSQFNDERELQPYFDKLLLIPGREVTTFQGHANVFGPTQFLDFRLAHEALAISDLEAEVERAHGLLSINHPSIPSGESCMGCGWTVTGTDYSRVQAIEVVNGGAMTAQHGAEGPLSGIGFWEAQLNQGRRITAIGGSDNHGAGTLHPSPIGRPTTAVYAPELSQRAILAAIQAGHAFVDVEGAHGRVLELTARLGRQSAAMGDALAAPAGSTVDYSLHVVGVAGGHVRIVEDGIELVSPTAAAPLAADATSPFERASDGRRHWLRADVYDAENHLVLVGNPIYLNF
jgi:hypothetical protein